MNYRHLFSTSDFADFKYDCLRQRDQAVHSNNILTVFCAYKDSNSNERNYSCYFVRATVKTNQTKDGIIKVSDVREMRVLEQTNNLQIHFIRQPNMQLF